MSTGTTSLTMEPTRVFHESRAIVKEIQAEQDPAQLLRLLQRAITVFDHNYQNVHNKLVVSGADKVLVERLEESVTQRERRKAIEPICRLLLMIYRCGNDQFQDSIAILGGDLFPPLLATLFIDDSIVETSAVELMQRLNQIKLNLKDVPWSNSLLDLFREVVDNVDPNSNVAPVSFIMTWLLEGLLLHSESNKLFMMSRTGCFDSIVTKFATTFRPGCRVNQNVSRLLNILSQVGANRPVMVQQRDFFRLLFLLLLDDKMETKVEIFKTLALTALDPVGRTRIFTFLNHKFIDLSIRALDDQHLVSSSLKFVYVLALHMSGKSLLSKRPALLAELTKQAMIRKEHSILAAQVIGSISKTLPVNSCSSEVDLLDALLQLCSAEDCKIRYEGACALLNQVQSQPVCSFFIAHVPEAKDAIAKIAEDNDSAVRALAAEIISNLASSPLNAKTLAENRPILDALVKNATRPRDESNETAQKHAVAAILRLVVQQRSIKTVAKQQHVVRSLSEYGSSGNKDQTLRQAALRGVVCLSSYI